MERNDKIISIKMNEMFLMFKKYWLLVLILLLFFIKGSGQNINIPNKVGPMGIEVNTRTGNLFLSRTDFYIPARQLDFDITFSYNSYNLEENTGYGNGWSFMYNMRYKIDTSGKVIIVWGEGREDAYTKSGGKFIPPGGIFESLSEYQPGKYLLKTQQGLQYYFDNPAHKRLTKLIEPNGNYQNLGYTDTLVTSITNAAGQTITLQYEAGKLISVTDANASPVQKYLYTYDGYGNLIKVTDAMGGVIKYGYLVNGPISSITDKNSNVADIIYYPDYSARELITCNARTSFSYDSSSRTTTVIDFVPTAQNQVTTYVYNEKGWLSKMTGNCCGYNMAFSYDNIGNLLTRTDANGNVYKYSYDDRGNYISVTDPQNTVTNYSWTSDFNEISGITDALGNVYSGTYDSKGNLTQITSPGNLQETFTYSANGDMLSFKDANNNSGSVTYDANGFPVKINLPLGVELQSSFDARGNLLSAKDANGNNYSFQYDSLNRPVKVTAPLNLAQSFTYDKEGNITAYIDAKGFRHQFYYDASNRIVSYKDPKGATSSFNYDAMDNLIQYKDALGKTSALTYDNLNRLTSVTDAVGNGFSLSYDAVGNVVTTVSPLGNTMHYTYDQLNRITGGNDDAGSFGNIVYDRNGRVTSYTNATGAAMSFSYDNLNRLTRVTDPLGNSRVFSYDNNSNLTTAKDRNNNTSSYTYNALNRLTSFTDNMGNHINIEYDAQGNPTKLTDQNGNNTLYEYDALNRPVKLTYADGRNIAVTYDNNGNITSVKLADGSVMNYTYDSTNMMVSKILPTGEQYIFNYDAKHRLTNATNAAGTVTFAYDDIDRVISEMYTTHLIKYDYNTQARTMTTTYPNGTVLTKTFDKRARLSNLSLNNHELTNYQYNSINQLTQKSFSNGVVTSYGYDNANRLNTISSNKSYLPSLSFQYDNEWNRTAVARTNDPQYSETFAYDANNRLINYKQGIISGNAISSPLIQNSYTYDAVGNRITANLNGVFTSYNVNNLNQYTRAGSINFTYDGNGNQTFDGNFNMRYDAEGRKLADSVAGNVYRYQYDAFGRRIIKSINAVATNYIYAGLQQIEERNASDGLIAQQVFEGGMSPLLRNYNSQNYFYHNTHLGSAESITDSTGNLIEHYRYEDFGKTTFYSAQNNSIAGSNINNRFLFTGQEYDNHNSSYKFHFRNYSTSTGSFNQRDPIGYGDGMGMYQYVGNNPGSFVDPLGLHGEEKGPPCPGGEKKGEHEAEHKKSEFEELLEYAHVTTYSSEKSYEFFEHSIQRGLKEGLFKLADVASSRLSYDKLGIAENIAEKAINFEKYDKYFKGVGNGLKGLGTGLSLLNWGIKSYKFGEALNTGNGYKITKAGGDLAQSGLGFTGVGGIYNLFDFAQEKLLTGQTMNENAEYAGEVYGGAEYNAELKVRKWTGMGDQSDEAMEQWHWDNGNAAKWEKARRKREQREEAFKMNHNAKHRKEPCPPNENPHGTQIPKPPKSKNPLDWLKWLMELITNHDPNLITGPAGVGNNKWVSINDRLPYQIQFENDSTATAPVKVVKVIYPIDPKQDINTFQLGSFGFNNLTFNTPDGANSYYQRLDARDSLGLYVDITAGIDGVNRQAFWIFESIDPRTQLPTNDPLKGFLLLQDKNKPTSGNGFVNFTIKPVSSAHTRDTISAIASIVFDANDTVPTNRYKNTIDALPPTTQLNSVVQNVSQNSFRISWHGNDDPGGVGLASYSLYTSINGAPFYLFKTDIKDTFAIISGSTDTTYCFFVAGKDSVGNQERLSNKCDLTFTFKGFGYVSTPTDYFRSIISGTWNATTTWESSPDNINYYPATLTPDSTAKAITIRNNHTVTVTTNVIISRTIVNPLATLVVTSSILTVANNGLTLQSDSTGSARIGNSTGTISGNVVVQRYIPANNNRAWRLLSVPTITSQTINAAWQNGQAPAAIGTTGIGTMITSNNGNTSFDFQTPGNSMLTYNTVTDAWGGIAGTTLPITTDRGWFLFVRGDRTATPLNNLRTPTTLSTTGGLKQGYYPSTPIAVAASRFEAIGNPYASQIDFRNVTKTNGIDNTFYVWDPKLTGVYGVGGYQTLTFNGSDYLLTPGSGSYGIAGSVMNTIESGQAFMVHASSAGNISFTENAKSSGNRMVFRTTGITDESLITNLYYEGNSGETLADGTLNLFSSNYSNSVDAIDALKLPNFGLSLGMTRENKILSVEKKQILSASDTIFFNLANAKPQQYRFEFIADRLNHPGLSAYLVDTYLNTNASVNLNGITSLNFVITNDSASAAVNRFMMVFSKPVLTPVYTKSIITVYPNPIQNGIINMQFVNMPKGGYSIRLVNALGQTIVSKQINHAEGSSPETIVSNAIKGAYMLEITKPDNSKQINKIIIN
ncbi:MAG: DUF6531 domain-containing protein [Bacteroidota bacterium]|nr:DUF6531 domain-containing protein [Bacteroidota bacterium]